MKCIVSVVVLWCICLVPLSVAAEFTKTKIAVLDFQMQSDNFANKHMGSIVAEWFTTALVKEGRFEVIERRLLSKVFEEQKLVMSGILDENSATQLGKVLGVKVIISGSVMKIGEILQVNARIIDVENASIIAAENVKSPSSAILQDLIVEMSRKISKNFPLQGYIVDRNNKIVTIDLGDLAGVKPGMEFIVYNEGAVIKHPKTGEILDVEKIITGRVKIKSVFGKISKAEIIHENKLRSISYAQLVSSVVDHATKLGKLYVETTPPGAHVRIINAAFDYHPGIELPPAAYQLEISAPRYESLKQWIKVSPEEKYRIAIKLQAYADCSSTNIVSTSVQHEKIRSPKNGNIYVAMLTSADSHQQLEAAQQILSHEIKEQSILDTVESELLYGYKEHCNIRVHVDAMARFCEVLGSSGDSSYKATLQTVTEFSTRRKLRKAALAGLKNLPD